MTKPKSSKKHTPKSSGGPFIPTAPQTQQYHSQQAIHIVTWYIVDPRVVGDSANDTTHHETHLADVTFAPLVELICRHSCYTHSVERLELVTPTEKVPPALVEELAAWISTSQTLRQLVLWTVDASVFHNPRELDYMRLLEQAAQSNPRCSRHCSVQMLTQGDPDVLCESLTLTQADTHTPSHQVRRHLALDGALLRGMTHHHLEKVAFDIAADGTTRILLLKDITNTHTLTTILETLAELSHNKLVSWHTLKLCWDPLLHQHASPKTPEHSTSTGFDVPTRALLALLKRPPPFLQRLYLGNALLHRINTPPLLEGLQHVYRARGGQQQQQFALELVACHFTVGSAERLEQAVVKARWVTHVSFRYPILVAGDRETAGEKKKKKKKKNIQIKDQGRIYKQ